MQYKNQRRDTGGDFNPFPLRYPSGRSFVSLCHFAWWLVFLLTSDRFVYNEDDSCLRFRWMKLAARVVSTEVLEFEFLLYLCGLKLRLR
jgi:hypothetical protein